MEKGVESPQAAKLSSDKRPVRKPMCWLSEAALAVSPRQHIKSSSST